MRQTPPGHAHDKYEKYEWPGGYTEFADGETYARVRLEEQLSPRSRVQGEPPRELWSVSGLSQRHVMVAGRR